MNQVETSQQERLLWLRQHSSQFDALLQAYSPTDIDNLLALNSNNTTTCPLPKNTTPWLPQLADDAFALEQAQQALRQAKNYALPYFLWWELGIHGDIEQSAKHLALFASGLLETALTMAKQLVFPRFGCLNAQTSRFSVIGLGKLGGMELNIGSDVDLLFVWDDDQASHKGASSAGGRTSVPAHTYFQHLARMLIRLMDERTIHGIVWLMDLRLRPNGDGAPLCLNLQATLNHYQDHGQTWERAMLLKASVVAGSKHLGQDLLDGLKPFIWRQYLDYTTVQALSAMKQRIDKQAGNHAIAVGFDVKRGVGGIREIEFMIQSLQLLHAGRNPHLRCTPSMHALSKLEQAEHINHQDANILRQAYRFWRRVEHAIQAQRGQHTHQLAQAWQDWLAAALHTSHIEQAMQQHAAQVNALFHQHFTDLNHPSAQPDSWLEENNTQLAQRISEYFPEKNAEQQQHMSQTLCHIQTQLHSQVNRKRLPERCLEQVQAITLVLLQQWQGDANAQSALQSWADLLHNISGRATWLDLISNQSEVRIWLANMLASSGFIAQNIAKNPSWLEWALPQQHTGKQRIQHICAQIQALDAKSTDEDVFLASLGRLVDEVRLTTAIYIASHDDVEPLGVGRWLSDMADAAVLAAMRLALAQYHLPDHFPMLALAMGKHGSQSMGLVSDLDMVFILVHPDPFATPQTNHTRQKNNREWAQRVGRRMIQHLSLRPPFGAGFDFDARLRPSGHAGVLVTTLQAFTVYQHEEAQTWEHQALCRARCLALQQDSITQVQAVILDVLHQNFAAETLKKDVINMRQKMMQHLSSKSAASINLKQDQGGLVDIEFLAQYARLLFHIDQTSTVGTLQQLPAHVPTAWQTHAPKLVASFLAYRQMEHALRVHLWASVARLPTNERAKEWETLRRHTAVKSVATLQEHMHKVHQIFKELLG